MRTRIKKRSAFEKERELLDFARSYLSEAFPNPERTGCPPDDALRLLAMWPMQSDESLGEHLTCCSPCFNAYMAHLARAKREAVQQQEIRRAAWLRRSAAVLATAVILLVAAYMFVAKRQSEPIAAPGPLAPTTTPERPAQTRTAATHVSVVINLSNASPTRGRKQGAASPHRQPTLPALPLDLTLRLPLGSEERLYRIILRSGGQVLWSTDTQVHQQNGQALLRMEADFSHVPAGSYTLQVTTSSGIRLSQAVLIKAALPEGTEQK